MTNDKDCGCGGHDETTEKTTECPCAAAKRKRIIILGVVAAIGVGFWAWKTGKLTSLWAWANKAQ